VLDTIYTEVCDFLPCASSKKSVLMLDTFYSYNLTPFHKAGTYLLHGAESFLKS